MQDRRAKSPNGHTTTRICATFAPYGSLATFGSPETIMETLGHSQISLTLNTYTHVLPELKKAAAAKMDAVLKR